MRKALESLPGVEKGSVEIDIENQLATFKVSDPKKFKLKDALAKIDDVGFKPSRLKSGAAISTQ